VVELDINNSARIIIAIIEKKRTQDMHPFMARTGGGARPVKSDIEEIKDSGLFDKDGLGTTIIELLPFGGFVTAPFHLAAGNDVHGAVALAGATADVVLPGAGGAIIKGARAGAKALVARKGLWVAGKAASAAAKGLTRGLLNVGVKELAKQGIKMKGANAIRKHQRK
jgi:hypothetical protein